MQKPNSRLIQIWKTDPLVASKTIFDSKLWNRQEEVFKSVWLNKYTAVKSGHTVGKSRICAEIALTFLATFQPSRVVTTAPTFSQVEDILWKEMHALYYTAKIPFNGQLNKTSLEMGIVRGKPWDAVGLSTNESFRFQGRHSPFLLVLVDEASGVAPDIWEAIYGLHPYRILAIGNPLEPSGEFYNCFQSDLWNKITIGCQECVDWQKKNGEIPGLVSQEWINERGHEWGRGSPMYQSRVLGEFPEDVESNLVFRSWVDKCRNNKLEEIEEDEPGIVGNDVATKHGENETVVGYRYGHTIPELKGYKKATIPNSAGLVKQKYEEKKATSIVIDMDGVGEGTGDILSENHIGYFAFHGGYAHKAIDYNKYRNLRTQFHCLVAKKLELGLYDLSKLPEKEYQLLKNQLCSIKVKAPDGKGRIWIESKEEMASRGIKSPDYSDTFVMMEYGFWMSRYAEIKGQRYR